MATCIEKTKCPGCDHNSLQTWINEDGRYSSFCFGQCGKPFGDPYKDKPPPEVEIKTPEQLAEELEDIKKCPYFMVKHRGIPGNVYKAWGCRLLVSEYDGKTPYAIAFPYTDEDEQVCGYKVVTLKGKSFWTIGNVRDALPFGITRALRMGGRRLYITEGEYDAIALEICFKESVKGTKYEKQKNAIVSLPAGGGSVKKCMTKAWDILSAHFDEFVMVVDDDEIGKKAEKDFQSLFPGALVSDKPFGCKDANDALKQGKMREMAQLAKFKAHKPPIQGVIHVRQILHKAKEKIEPGLSFGLGDEFDRISFGQIWGELMSTGGATGSGKTLIAHQTTEHNIFVHKEPVFNVLLEEDNVMTLRNVAGKHDGICYHNPRVEYDEDKYMDTIEQLDGKLLLWEGGADLKLRFDLDAIMQAIRFNHAEFGTRIVNIDNMTCLVDHLGTGEANEFINKYSSELANMADQLGLFINIFSHVNAPKWGASHEQGAPIFPNQFTGSKGLMRACPKMAVFERNKYAEVKENRSFSLLGVVKNRKYGSEEKTKTIYDGTTGRLSEHEWSTVNGTLMDEDPKQKPGRR